ncbi:unnamed protein product [Rotaria magnacalcarata]|uniref:Uncharacterized protein n=1 Tax=Rotaria magnacalcarata TaxID=392030 RepID=A0A816YB10_9BILA|nr:unnamed protein product [Rotaria magnacalcarata]CAF1639988.1 unnamed protein product [Rotaria magnacalcarata]CAF2041548.1 unnamed protein product [Rotaria magnacalcarata]CAF2154560.1 unnamed protein product [Rotaria magnacalcarata]CAF2160180.1 unnamed protein product [Rotaria magnacalcarata]
MSHDHSKKREYDKKYLNSNNQYPKASEPYIAGPNINSMPTKCLTTSDEHSSSGQLHLIHTSASHDRRLMSITPRFKVFLICSGLLYFLFVIVIIGLDIGLIFSSYWTWYLGFSLSGLLISAGISTLVISCQSTYALLYFLYNYIFALVGSSLISIASIVNLALSKKCSTIQPDSKCDGTLAFSIKVTLAVLFILSFIHSTVNLVVAAKRSTTRVKVLQTATD